MFRSVLIVCHANVCRSPAAEMLFRAYAGKLAMNDPRRPIEFRSAGLFGLATQEEVSVLRSTIQTLEDNLAIIESKSAAAGR